MPEPMMTVNSQIYPSQDVHEVKVKIVFRREITVKYMHAPLHLDSFRLELSRCCGFDSEQPFTIKWLDDEGDPCTIDSQRELDEAMRLHQLHRDSELFIHVWPSVPQIPGLPCPGEEKGMYHRRGARRWKKSYWVNGHLFQPKRFSQSATCAFCHDRVWGLGLQGIRCMQCKIIVHKRCHKLIKPPCPGTVVEDPQAFVHGPRAAIADGMNGVSIVNRSSGLAGEAGHRGSGRSSGGGRRWTKPTAPMSNLIDGGGESTNGVDKYQAAIEDSLNKEGSASYVNPIFPDDATEEAAVQPNAGFGNQWNDSNWVEADDGDGRGDRSHKGFPASPQKGAPSQQQKNQAISLDHFEMLRVIGRGSYAKVLQVELKSTKQIYAMKIIKKEIMNDDEDIDWVQTEKHVFEVASNHPFLVGLHSCFQTSSRLFFVIEFVPGGDLMFHMQNQRRLPEEHARFYSAEIILALHYLHSRGIIYRDLKLDNVLIDADGHIKLTDYGMCKEGLFAGETTSTFCGTPNYIAPEILRGEEYSFSVDWWALGVLMYEMMAGRSPFDVVGPADNPDANTEDYLFQIILEKQIRIPRSVSVRAASVLAGFLNKNPQERLGCHPETGFEDIQGHAFFKTVDWALVEEKQAQPHYRPPIRDERDLANFDKLFTDEPVELTPDDQEVIGKIDQSEFEGFEYVNPLLMSREDNV